MPLNIDQNLPFSEEDPILTRFEHFQSGFCEQVCCARAQASTPGLARSLLLMTMMMKMIMTPPPGLAKSLLLMAMMIMVMIL